MENPVFEVSTETLKVVSKRGSTNDLNLIDGNTSDCLSQTSASSCDNLISEQKS